MMFFPVNSVGIVTARDKLAVQWTAEDMRTLVADFPPCSTEYVRKVYGLRASSDDSIYDAQRDILDHLQSGEHLAPLLYRPFDVRFTWYTGRAGGLIERPRREVMRHMLDGENRALISVRQVAEGIFNHAFATRGIADFRTTLSNKGGAYLFPNYIYPTEGQEHLGLARQPNLAGGLVEAISSSLGLEFISDGSGNLQESFGPDDVFNYIYAVLHSPNYRCRYADFLKSDYPRIPLPSGLPPIH